MNDHDIVIISDKKVHTQGTVNHTWRVMVDGETYVVNRFLNGYHSMRHVKTLDCPSEEVRKAIRAVL